MNKLFWKPIVIASFALLLACCGPDPTTPFGSVPPASTSTSIDVSLTDTSQPIDTNLSPGEAYPPSEEYPPVDPYPTPEAYPLAPPTLAPFELTSPAFEPDQPIPILHACHGENLSPPLTWSGPPLGTQSFALIMEDPDAVKVAGFVWDHWILFDIPANVLSLSEGLPNNPEMPDGSRQGTTSFKRLGYGGPCPPGGQTHNYVFTLYALDSLLNLEAGAGKEDILQAMGGHILAQVQLIGLYTSP